MGLDTVEIVMCWEESLGISIPDRDAEHLVTPAKAVEYLAWDSVLSIVSAAA